MVLRRAAPWPPRGTGRFSGVWASERALADELREKEKEGKGERGKEGGRGRQREREGERGREGERESGREGEGERERQRQTQMRNSQK